MPPSQEGSGMVSMGNFYSWHQRESFPVGTVLLGVIFAPPILTRFYAEEGELVARAAEGLDFSEGPKVSL